MKRKVFIVVLVFVLLLFSSCGGLKDLNSISADDYINGTYYSINVSVKNADTAPGYTYFAIPKDIEELRQEIADKSSNEDTVEVCQGNFILIKEAASCFLIQKIEKLDVDQESYNRYVLFAPIGTFEANKEKDKYVYMYLPYHLLKGINVQHYQYQNPFSTQITCETIGTIDDFYDFYHFFEQCEVDKDADSLIITNKISGYKMEVSFSQNSKSNV